MVNYVPDRGHIIWLSFNPQAGREQAGRRPALVLSPALYNDRSALAIVCPITSQVKGYPFEVPLPDNLNVTGVVLADHIKSLDWRMRNAEFINSVSEQLVSEVLEKLNTLLES